MGLGLWFGSREVIHVTNEAVFFRPNLFWILSNRDGGGGFGQDLFSFPVREEFHDSGTLFHEKWKERGELESEDCDGSEGLGRTCKHVQEQVGDRQTEM